MCDKNTSAYMMLNLISKSFYLVTDAWGNVKAYKIVHKIEHASNVHSYFCLAPFSDEYNAGCYIWDHGSVDTPHGPKKSSYASYEIYSARKVSQSVAELYWGKPLK